MHRRGPARVLVINKVQPLVQRRSLPLQLIRAMSEMPQQGVPRLRELLKQYGEQGWDKAWEESVTPWEAHNRDDSGVRRPLSETLEGGYFPVPKTGRVLVPGCGRGFDAIYFARHGYEAWGIDLSSKAVEAAEA